MRVTFVSDLHLFSRRSDAPQHHAAIAAAADRSAALVLGGDIFDFRWSTFGTDRETVDAAMDWLDALACAHPRCHIYYLLGNHDYCRPLLDRLEREAAAAPNFSWHPFHLRLGDHIFLHGDAAEPGMTPEKLLAFRTRWQHKKPPGRLRRHAYDLVHHAGLHRPIPYLIHSKRRVARRLVHYLDHLGEGLQTGVRHVYFGHTHRHMVDYHYHGLTFHNGGAPIGGSGFRVLESIVR